MKTLVLANQKGGVGKSAIAVQLAYFLTQMLEKRVLLIDFDHQCNTTKAVLTGGLATSSEVESHRLLSDEVGEIEQADFLLVPGASELMKLEKQGDQHNLFATHLHQFLQNNDHQFDVCIIDTNPNPDIRQLASLVVSDFILSPIQLNQEAINGIGDLLNHETIGIRKIKATINKKLKLIGILPNMVEPTPFQRENFRELSAAFGKLLIPIGKNYAAIKRSTAIPEAQAAGLPIWKLKKSSARDAWSRLRPIFEKIVKQMGVK